MGSPATPAMVTPCCRSTRKSYLMFWLILATAGFSSTGRSSARVRAESRPASLPGPPRPHLVREAVETPLFEQGQQPRCIPVLEPVGLPVEVDWHIGGQPHQLTAQGDLVARVPQLLHQAGSQGRADRGRAALAAG